MLGSQRFFRLAGITVVALGAMTAQAFDVLPKTPPIPRNNPMSADKIILGKQLFFDSRLSSDGTVSCNSCHNVMSNGTDNLPFSAGINGQRGGRSSPTVFNAAYMSVQFWDGRAASLEDQAKGPLVNPVEMGMKGHDIVVKRIEAIPGYRDQFKKVFGGADPVTIDHVAAAIASYERTLVTPNSPVDRYVKGDKKALSESAVRGMGLVQTVGCVSCHMGPNYAGPALPEGTGFYQQFPKFPGSTYDKKYNLLKDNGRFDVTHKEEDRHFYRVPTWRNIALTAPYFHNGSVKSLDEAVRVMAKTQLDKELTEAEVADIVSFLDGLTGEFPKQEMPRLPQTPNTTIIE